MLDIFRLVAYREADHDRDLRGQHLVRDGAQQFCPVSHVARFGLRVVSQYYPGIFRQLLELFQSLQRGIIVDRSVRLARVCKTIIRFYHKNKKPAPFTPNQLVSDPDRSSGRVIPPILSAQIMRVEWYQGWNPMV